MGFDVITYGNGMFLQDVFNAIASIFGNDSYQVALATCMMMASTGVLISMALQGRLNNYLWFVQVIFFYLLLVVPKVTVHIVDKNDMDPTVVGGWSVRTVDNVPIGVALTASATSTFSSWLTTSFETVFSLPDDMRYDHNGPLFTQNLVQEAMTYKVRDASLLQSIQNFWKNCVFYDVSLGFYSFDTLAKQSNILEFLKTNTAQTRGFYMMDSAGGQSFTECRAGVSTLETKIWADETLAQLEMTKNAHVSLPDSNQVARSGWTSMPVGFAYLTNISITASDLLTQSAMINSMDDGLSAMAGQADVQGAIQGYAIARAERERESTFGAMGKLAADMLPILKNLCEGLVIAVFPLIGLAIMFPNGWKVMMHYARVLIWISLWPVCFALLHYAVTFFGAFAMQKAACFYEIGTTCSPVYSTYTQLGIVEVMKKYTAIAGYLMTMIPMLSYMFVSQAGSMMAGLVGRVMDGYAAPAQHAAAEASAGNFSVGNLSFQNQSAFQHTSAPSQSVGYMTKDDGMYKETVGKSGEVIEQKVSSLGISANTRKSFEAAATRAVESAESFAANTSATLSEARARAMRDAFNEMRGGTEVTSAGSTSQQSDQHTLSRMAETVRSSAEKYADGQKWSKDEKNAFVRDAVTTMTAGGSVGLEIAGTGAQVGGKMENKENNSSSSSTGNAKSFDRVREYLSSDSAKEALNQLHSLSTARQAGHTRTSTRSEDNQSSVSFESAQRAEQAHTAALQHLESAKAAKTEAEKQGFNLDIQNTPELIHEFKKRGIEWQKGVSDLEGGVGSNEARQVQDVLDQYFESKVDRKIDESTARNQVRENATERMDQLRQGGPSDTVPRTNELAARAERQAAATEKANAGQVSQLDERQSGLADFVRADVNSGTVRIGQGVTNDGSEGAYPIPPDRPKDEK